MVKERIQKMVIILAGIVCVSVFALCPVGRTRVDLYVGKKAEVSNRFKNDNAIEKAFLGKGQESTEVPGSDIPDEDTRDTGCIKEIDFGYQVFATQDDIIQTGQLHYLERLRIGINDDRVDMTPLGNLRELKELSIYISSECNPDLSFMEELGKLEKLDIQTGESADLSPLGSLSGLKVFSMAYQDVPDLSFLRELDHLEEVTMIKVSGLNDMSYFQDMADLKRLNISYVEDVDLEYLRKCDNLECINIVGQNIRNPEALANMTHLGSLHLDNTYQGQEVFDLSPLAQLSELDSVMLIYLPIKDVSPLAEADSLTFICLAGTCVEDISSLKDLKLDSLWIFGNKSENVRKQAEEYFCDIADLVVEESVPENSL